MNYCKYHPLDYAPWICAHCGTSVCTRCIDSGKSGDQLNCILCGRGLDVQAVTSKAYVPFWRRLQESFRYPLNGNSLTLIVCFALFSTIVESASIFFLAVVAIYLLMLSAMLKYCFSCLEHTSLGDMQAPDITEAYGGGFQTLAHLFVMILFIGAVIIFVGRVLGDTFASLAAVVMFMGFPAILINYALTASLTSAMNLASMFRLIATIGLPYGLLIAFIMIMSGSVGVIHSLIGDRFAFISSFLQYIVTWYYTIVTFHIMGYMIYQYQDRLGFVAHGNGELEHASVRSEEQNLLAKINVFLKEGELDKVVKLFEEGSRKFSQSEVMLQRYFDFLLRTKSKDNLNNFASRYLIHQIKCSRFDKLGMLYKQILAVVPDYSPQEPELRFYIARACLRAGDSSSAVKLIRGLHRSHPQFERLIDAYEVMYEAMQGLPNMQDQLAKCGNLLEHLRTQQPPSPSQTPLPRKAMFAASDVSNSQASLTTEVTPVVEQQAEQSQQDKPDELPPIEFKL